MTDILHQLLVKAPPALVFPVLATPSGLDAWWTARAEGFPAEGSTYGLWFPPDFQWKATVTIYRPDEAFELKITKASDDWMGSRVGFHLSPHEGSTVLDFHHAGWSSPSDHFRISSFCWASYLRLMRRHVENGEVVAYADRDAA
jgi:uncharacterized protein YndB with AHSA1/START domain